MLEFSNNYSYFTNTKTKTLNQTLMLTATKKAKLLNNLKVYSKKYLNKMTELDESGTRLMVNHFLTDVLGFTPIEEVKTEYMIRGTYADYVIQTKNERNFLVEVKALSFALSEKHLRQAVNYGANEGIDWALLTNGKNFQFYRILFNKPIESRKVFEFDLSDSSQFKDCVELMQYITKDGVTNKGLSMLWNKTCALDPANVAGLLFNPSVTNFIKRTLRNKFKSKFGDDEINASLKRVIYECIPMESVKMDKVKKKKPVVSKLGSVLTILKPVEPEEIPEQIATV
jgi:hypothetical protein